MSDLRELYQEVILEHYRRPRNTGRLASATHRAAGDNPLCGDRIAVAVAVDGDVVADVAFEGAGCAISTASASLMTEAVRGLSVTEAEALTRRFHAVVVEGADFDAEALGPLAALTGVRDYPVRVKCATLAWHTLRAALERGAGAAEADEVVTTE